SCFTVVILVYLLGGFHPHTQTIRHSPLVCFLFRAGLDHSRNISPALISERNPRDFLGVGKV
ncbi:hypothetical protein, partial [Actinotignum sp. GS-2025b]|uniref:hypothetical protein n=1 Tax=Actinotignum sp. GS-2025b TaxID=3427275 RepID=UPI003F45E0DB